MNHFQELERSCEITKNHKINLSEKAGALIRKLRKAKEMTMEDICLKTMNEDGEMITRQSMSQYETGGGQLTLKRLERILDALEINMIEFFTLLENE